MGKASRIARRISISLIGFPLLVVGMILIPLPGPGLIVCFAAFLILALEFDWADKYLAKAKRELRNIYERAKARADHIENLGGPKK